MAPQSGLTVLADKIPGFAKLCLEIDGTPHRLEKGQNNIVLTAGTHVLSAYQRGWLVGNKLCRTKSITITVNAGETVNLVYHMLGKDLRCAFYLDIVGQETTTLDPMPWWWAFVLSLVILPFALAFFSGVEPLVILGLPISILGNMICIPVSYADFRPYRSRLIICATITAIGWIIGAVLVMLFLFANQPHRAAKVQPKPLGTDAQLRQACISSDPDIKEIRELIKAGADVNAADESGRTPLFEAVGRGHAHIAKLLIDAGANVNIVDKSGRTPLYRTLRRADIVKLLITAGADVNATDKRGYTPLHGASRANRIDSVKLLITAGADVNAANKRGTTPLHEASREDCAEVVKLLLAAKADINAVDEDGKTPLHVISTKWNSKAAKLLKAAGAK